MKKLLLTTFFVNLMVALSFSSQILCLYKSSDQTTANDNEIQWHFSNTIKSLHYKMKFHDMDQGFPDQTLLKDSIAIFTWFRGAAMKNAEMYAQWLKDQIINGKRVLIFGSYGAYQDKDSQKWLTADKLNVFFKEFGLEYKGNWTQSENLIKIDALHPLLTASKNSKIFRRPNYYLQFKSIHEDNRILASIKRSDQKDSQSAVIAVTTKGAFAISPYICWQDKPDQPFKYAFERKRFLQSALFYKGGTSSKKVICLYKSVDNQGIKENEIRWHIESHLKKFKKVAVYHDLSQGLPDETISDQAAAVITWFRSAELKGADAYISWLLNMIQKEKKVLIFGNMGAYKEKDAKEWIESVRINELYKAIGFEYFGQWTDKLDVLKISSIKKAYFHEEASQYLSKINHYLQFKPTHPKTLSLLTVKRSDLKDSKSSLMMISPFGSYASGPYVLSLIDGKIKYHLNLEKFLNRALN